MKETKINGVYKDKNQLFTKNPKHLSGVKVYNEKIKRIKGDEYRSWMPYRSKLAAFLQKKGSIELKPDYNILYLGAATGTTVSHISDILTEGMIYAVESSAVAMKKLIEVSKKRKNIVPIYEDAFHFEKYQAIVPNVDFLYQDISQRNQSEIFSENTKNFLKNNSKAILMVKARSIDVALKPKDAYKKVVKDLESEGLIINKLVDLSPYEKDHAAVIIKKI